MRADRLRVLDGLEQLDFIRRFRERGRDAFLSDVVLQSAVLHRLALLGEACRRVSPGIRASHPEIPWAQITGFRNVIIHQYFGIDLELVWTIVEAETDALAFALARVLHELPE
jgi:uncharacterized protein with HEPN domain